MTRAKAHMAAQRFGVNLVLGPACPDFALGSLELRKSAHYPHSLTP